MNNRRKHLIFAAVLLVMASVVASSCGSIVIAIPNRWNERYARSHDDIECLTAEQIKEMIVSDTTHYKVVMIHSSGCGPCSLHLQRTYAPEYAKHRDDVKFIIISESTGGIRYCKDELERNGMFEGKVLCLLDEDSRFCNQKNCNIQYLNNLTNYIFTNGPEVTGNFGLPCEFIVSKDNRVLKQEVITPSSPIAIKTMYLWQIDFDHIQDIDFDSLYRLELDYDYYENLPICTGDQCPIR